MNISNLLHNLPEPAVSNPTSSRSKDQPARPDQKESPAKVDFVQVDIQETRELRVQVYDKRGKVAGDSKVAPGESRHASAILYDLKIQIQKQTRISLLRYSAEAASISDRRDKPDDLQHDFGLSARFVAHPEEWQQVQRGEIPRYFNVENTAKRILDILIAGNEPDKGSQKWWNRKRDLLEKAYGEVKQGFGGLPDIVKETREYVLEQLLEMQHKDMSIAKSLE